LRVLLPELERDLPRDAVPLDRESPERETVPLEREDPDLETIPRDRPEERDREDPFL